MVQAAVAATRLDPSSIEGTQGRVHALLRLPARPNVWVPLMATLLLFATGMVLFDVSSSYPAMLDQAQELVAAGRSSLAGVPHVMAPTSQGEPTELRMTQGEPAQRRPPMGPRPEVNRPSPPAAAAVVDTPRPRPRPRLQANKKASAQAQKKAKKFHPPCNFTISHFDPECPRFVHIEPMTSHRGLGDRFVQFLIPYLFALEAKGACVSTIY